MHSGGVGHVREGVGRQPAWGGTPRSAGAEENQSPICSLPLTRDTIGLKATPRRKPPTPRSMIMPPAPFRAVWSEEGGVEKTAEL